MQVFCIDFSNIMKYVVYIHHPHKEQGALNKFMINNFNRSW